MSHDKPVGYFDEEDEERTVIVKPTPGGRRQQRPDAPQISAPAQAAAGRVDVELPPRNGLNPLEVAAAPLLDLLIRLRDTATYDNPLRLRGELVEGINSFVASAREKGVNEKVVYRARYVMCTVLDEAVLNTPWGSASSWSEQSLLSTFHNETWGGEKFFQLQEQLIQDPAGNIDLLELMYLCLAFGFEGRYRVLDNGRSRLEDERDRLYRVIRNHRGEFERELSPRWRGIIDKVNPMVRFVPLWVMAAVAAALLLIIYIGFSFWLARVSDPEFVALSAIRGDAVALVKRPAVIIEKPKPKPEPIIIEIGQKLRQFLEPEIQQGLVQLIEESDRTTIRIVGDGLFDSGDDRVKSSFQPLLRRIGEELNTVSGKVLVSGHTDSIPIRTLRFPSNWDLSKARADSVLAILSSMSNEPNRFWSEGRAETEPLATNKTPEGRARNRRVEIILFSRVK